MCVVCSPCSSLFQKREAGRSGVMGFSITLLNFVNYYQFVYLAIYLGLCITVYVIFLSGDQTII